MERIEHLTSLDFGSLRSFGPLGGQEGRGTSGLDVSVQASASDSEGFAHDEVLLLELSDPSGRKALVRAGHHRLGNAVSVGCPYQPGFENGWVGKMPRAGNQAHGLFVFAGHDEKTGKLLARGVARLEQRCATRMV